MSSAFALRDFRPSDAAELNRIALAAFAQFKSDYADWPAMAAGVSRMSKLAEIGEIVVAEVGSRVAGGITFIPAGQSNSATFDPAWPIIRMLVVDPIARGQGIGRSLVEECVRRARRDGACYIALHTTQNLTVALPMYLRMGFKLQYDAPPIHGVPCAVYTLDLSNT